MCLPLSLSLSLSVCLSICLSLLWHVCSVTCHKKCIQILCVHMCINFLSPLLCFFRIQWLRFKCSVPLSSMSVYCEHDMSTTSCAAEQQESIGRYGHNLKCYSRLRIETPPLSPSLPLPSLPLSLWHILNISKCLILVVTLSRNHSKLTCLYFTALYVCRVGYAVFFFFFLLDDCY